MWMREGVSVWDMSEWVAQPKNHTFAREDSIFSLFLANSAVISRPTSYLCVCVCMCVCVCECVSTWVYKCMRMSVLYECMSVWVYLRLCYWAVGVVSVFSQYNCVYYCMCIYMLHTSDSVTERWALFSISFWRSILSVVSSSLCRCSELFPVPSCMHSVILIGVFSVYMQYMVYNGVYYCDTWRALTRTQLYAYMYR
jgi:hypothetical protein